MRFPSAFHFIWIGLVAAQDVVVIPRQIPRRVGIINDAPTPGAWVVHELKLFFSATCDEASWLEPASTTDIYDTGTRLETALVTAGAYAFDNVLWTNWTADCMVQLGGCLANTVGLGIDISFTEARKVMNFRQRRNILLRAFRCTLLLI